MCHDLVWEYVSMMQSLPPTCYVFNIRKHDASEEIPDTCPHTQPHQAQQAGQGHPGGAPQEIGDQHHQQD